MITVKCPTCGVPLNIEEKYQGLIGKCVHCNGPVPVPEVLPARTKTQTHPFVKLLCIVLVGGLLWVINILVTFDVSKPANQYAEPVEFQKDPMSEALLEEIHYTAKLDYLKSPSRRSLFGGSVEAWQASLDSYTPQASVLPWETYTSSLKGERVYWVGYVMESKRRLFFGHDVVIEIPGNRIMNLALQVSGDMARSLSIGQDVAFEGTVASIDNTPGLCFVFLEDATIYAQ